MELYPPIHNPERTPSNLVSITILRTHRIICNFKIPVQHLTRAPSNLVSITILRTHRLIYNFKIPVQPLTRAASNLVSMTAEGTHPPRVYNLNIPPHNPKASNLVSIIRGRTYSFSIQPQHSSTIFEEGDFDLQHSIRRGRLPPSELQWPETYPAKYLIKARREHLILQAQ